MHKPLGFEVMHFILYVRVVITQSPPRPKGPLALYVHTQETVDHTLLRVAVCSTTVEADSVCM